MLIEGNDVNNREIFSTCFREFLASCLFSTHNRKPYELPWEQKTIWSLLFGTMLMVAISGNIIVLWIVLGKFNFIATDFVTFLVQVHFKFCAYHLMSIFQTFFFQIN